MLLRLLPRPTPSQPTPPTILFTLPLPTHPYTSRSLPLPANLLAHKTVCLHEDIDCSNVLLGEKSTWISGVSHPLRPLCSVHANEQIIDDVTFSLPLQTVRIHFIDGSTTTLPIDSSCAQSLGSVVDQVNLSFAPKSTTPSRPTSRASSSSASSSRSSPVSPRRSSTSALLLTLLSPLLPTSSSQTSRRYEGADPQYASRMYRRQARSLLVDAYRRYVLPELKSSLPGAYLSWAIESEVAQRTVEYEDIKLEINSVLASTGYDTEAARAAFKTRARSFTSSTISSMGSDYEEEMSQDTPSSSVHSSRCSSPHDRLMTASPHAFLLAIPPAHELPQAYRQTYSHHLAELTRIASRLSSIKRLDSQYEREESKRRWLENLERGKAGDRALRRAWSNGQTRVTHTSYYQPNRSSSLWRSWTAEDEERSHRSAPVHPAMMDEEDEDIEMDVDVDSLSESSSVDEITLITPPSSVRGSISSESCPPSPNPTRPSLSRKPVPTLQDLEQEEWQHLPEDHQKPWTVEKDEEETKVKAFTLPPLPPRPEKWSALPQLSISIPRARGLKTRFTDWVRSDRDDRESEQEVAVLPVLY